MNHNRHPLQFHDISHDNRWHHDNSHDNSLYHDNSHDNSHDNRPIFIIIGQFS